MKSPSSRRRTTFLPALALCLAGVVPAAPGGEVSGCVRAVCGDREVPLGAMRVFATPLGDATAPSRVFRSWETEPAGWWRIEGPAGTVCLRSADASGTQPPMERQHLRALDPLDGGEALRNGSDPYDLGLQIVEYLP